MEARAPFPTGSLSLALDDIRMSFANRVVDCPLVKQIYQRAFTKHMASVVSIDCRNLGWGDAEVVKLCEMLRHTAPPSCRRIDLEGNKLGRAGVTALAESLQRRAAPQLYRVWLGSGSEREEAHADDSTSFVTRDSTRDLSGVNALSKHPAWDATAQSRVRMEGGLFIATEGERAPAYL